MGRAKVPQVYEPGFEMKLGGSRTLREGADVTLVACGVEVDEALKAAETLAQQGIEAEVIDAYSIKPLDEEAVLASAAKTGLVVTCEEHNVVGGLGSIVASLLSRRQPTRMGMVGVQDVFGTSGEFGELMAHYHCDAAAIVARCSSCAGRDGRADGSGSACGSSRADRCVMQVMRAGRGLRACGPHACVEPTCAIARVCARV